MEMTTRSSGTMHPMDRECVYTFDGSTNGFLCVVFSAFEQKTEPIAILSRRNNAQIPMGTIVQVDTCCRQSARVRKGIIDRSDKKNFRRIQTALFSGSPSVYMLVWNYLKKLFAAPHGTYYRNMLDETVYALVDSARKVRKEVHRFHGFVRFQETKEGIFAAAIDPDNDIAGLLAPHFVSRFPDRKWLIYDMHRKYGIFFDNCKVLEITMIDRPFDITTGAINQCAKAMSEDHYRTLWQHYYDAITISERKNLRQMRAAMPRRYWKYLPEKNGKQ